jgi:hypothetical protein
MLVITLLVVLAILAVSVQGAIDAHRIETLPGYAAGKLPSTHYSGCKYHFSPKIFFVITKILLYYRYSNWNTIWSQGSITLLVN